MTNATQPQPPGWAIDDPITRLRVVGTNRVFELSAKEEWIVGTAADSDIQLVDPTGRASRRHARVWYRNGWWIDDLESTNGSRCDGERRSSFQLTPGAEIRFGGIAMMVESDRLRRLHAYLSRMLGWSAERRLAVDRAVQAVREMATRRAVLVVAGAGDITSCVREIHLLAVSAVQPLFVADQTATARQALSETQTGTICMLSTLAPREIADLVAETVLPDAETRLVFCCDSLIAAANSMALLRKAVVIVVPAVAERPDSELDRLLLEYARDASRSLGAAGPGFRDHELVWLRKLEYPSLAEAAETAARVVAIRNFGVTRGAARLGISHASLSRWAKRRRIPT